MKRKSLEEIIAQLDKLAEEYEVITMSLVGIFLILFLILKVTDVIDWSWLWVLSPIWIPVAFFLVIVVLGLVGIKLLK
jgi:hypothetical protein